MTFNRNINDLLLHHRACLSEEELSSYSLNTLSSDEAHQVETHLIDCPFCADALEGVSFLPSPDSLHQINQNIHSRIDQILAEKMSGSPQPESSEPIDDTPVIPFFRKFGKYAIAASLAALLAITGIYMLNQDSSITLEQSVAAVYEEAYDPISAVAGDSGDSPIFAIRESFHRKDFKKVIELGNLLSTEDPNLIPARFYLAQAQMKTGQYDQAKSTLESIIASQEIDYTDHAEWLLGNVYLSQGKVEQANQLFNKIALSDGHYYQEASTNALKTTGSIKD